VATLISENAQIYIIPVRNLNRKQLNEQGRSKFRSEAWRGQKANEGVIDLLSIPSIKK